jgi:hypothetical protein
MFWKICTATLSLAVATVLACAMSGCDTGSAKTEYKPIEGNILKKLGQANGVQTPDVSVKKHARSQKR